MSSAGRMNHTVGFRQKSERQGPMSLKSLKLAVSQAARRGEVRAADREPKVRTYVRDAKGAK